MGKETLNKISVLRFMIDHNHQHKGLGRRALELALIQIKETPNINEIEICYNPKKPIAKSFYSSFGFVETGMGEDNEDMLAIITI